MVCVDRVELVDDESVDEVVGCAWDVFYMFNNF